MNGIDAQRFVPSYIPAGGSGGAVWNLVFFGRKLLMLRDGQVLRIPRSDELEGTIGGFEDSTYIGEFDGHGCYCMSAQEGLPLPQGLEPVDLRAITELTGDEELFRLAGTASHILNWSRLNQYCGRCGHKTVDKPDERAKICPACGNVVYVRISPATITAVVRGDEILLAHNRNFPDGLYSLIAGFVEPGETPEQCAAREIYEEVGVRVKNLRYFCSQHWPFPDSLMLAFTAEYASGEITADGQEITSAGWFRAGSLPVVATPETVAGRIIRWFCDGQAQG